MLPVCYLATCQKVKLFHILLLAWRVTLVVAFGPKILGSEGEPTNAILSFHECRLNGGDT